MIDDALERAAANNFTVLRMWTYLNADFCANTSGWDGVWNQCYDSSTGSVYINETNVARLDYVLQKAASVGVRLVLTLTGNWNDFGGMDAYVRWRTFQDPSFLPFHDSFYTDETIKGWYKQWASALVTRMNPLTGIAYMDDPTIFAWQLANEPRCQTYDGFNTSSNGCVGAPGQNPTSALVPWVDEMSTFIKSIDPNHMISVGDEGFYCNRTSNAAGSACTPNSWWCDCSIGVDSLGFMALPNIDYGTAHLYPEAWGTDAIAASWGSEWILNHTQQAHSLATGPKPFVVEEFGIANVTNGRQRAIYTAWTSTALSGGLNGWHYWMLAGLSDPSDWYPGDGLNIYCTHAGDPALPAGHDGQTCATLSAAAQQMMAGNA